MAAGTTADVWSAQHQWPRALASHPTDELLALAAELTARYPAEPLVVPQAGLAMLPLRDSVAGQPFNLGELPLSVAHVSLTCPDGTTVTGGAALMRDDADLAVALAVIEGVLAARLEGWEPIAELVSQGLAAMAREATVRRSMLARSKVDFALLDQADEEAQA